MKTYKNFADCNADIDPDPLKELMRRRQMWAMAPDVDHSAIVPDATIDAAIQELLSHRIKNAVTAEERVSARNLYERYFDL